MDGGAGKGGVCLIVTRELVGGKGGSRRVPLERRGRGGVIHSNCRRRGQMCGEGGKSGGKDSKSRRIRKMG